VAGYDREEPSHAALAQAVASGAADAGLGIAAAARARGLDFVPLLQEHYYLVCLKEALDEPPIAALRQLLQGQAWQRELAALPGYAPWHSGEVLSLRAQLPWWKLPPKKKLRHPREGGDPGRPGFPPSRE
jgi:putative molybdopterin biosynthesis protein